jgi:hypothetical protein
MKTATAPRRAAQKGEAILTWAKKPGRLAGLELLLRTILLSNAGAGFWFQPLRR